MNRISIPYFMMICVVCVAVVSGCGSSSAPDPTPTPNIGQIRMPVIQMYKAILQNDPDAYMDVILPANRRVLNPVNMLQALSLGYSAGGFGVSLDIGQLTKISFRDLDVEVVSVDGAYALVRATGNVRYPGLMLELPFCDMHDLRLESGKWYVDVYASERKERIARIVEKKQAALGSSQGVIPTPSSELDLTSLLMGFGPGLEEVLDMCE